MKTIKYVLTLFVAFSVVTSCQNDDDNLDLLNDLTAPTEVSATFNVSQDNTGTVLITPNAVGAATYNITLGDGTETPVAINQGESTQHVYDEGTYTVTVEAVSINGLTTEVTQQLVVSFRAPENLEITAEIDASNPFQVNVSASADYAASFEVYFDTSNPDEEATPLALGDEVSFEYDLVGDYTVRVVALSGGVETTEDTVVVTIATPTELPIDFEIFDTTVFFGFGGATGEIIDNPDTNGNESAKVAKIVKGAPEVWAGNVIVASSPIDFSTKKVMKFDVWSPRPGGTFTLKLENLDDANTFIEVSVPLVGNSEWEEVSIDLSEEPNLETESYQKIVWFFDLGTAGDGGADWTFYVDNIRQDFAGVVVSQIIEDFEGTPPTFISFGNIADTEVVANPDMSGINTSANVAQLTKTNGSEVWAGTLFETDAPIDLASFGQINVKTWSPNVGAVVKLKLENADASTTYEVDLPTTVANQWENLLYDFNEAPAADYVKVVIFFDFGNSGDDSVYYYDDVELVGTLQDFSFQDFEGTAPSFISFGNIADTQVISNPDASGINTTANVAQFTKTSGSEVWAGTLFVMDDPLDLTTYNQISVKTWSPTSGIVVKLKLENADASITYEVDITNSVANGWEELVYDFSEAPAADYVTVVIFFDFGNSGDDSIYYFDEFTLTN
ncbi:phage tail protein [Psychroserpens sp. MEBiC05023]